LSTAVNMVFKDGITKCSDAIYNKITYIHQHNMFIGTNRLHVSTC